MSGNYHKEMDWDVLLALMEEKQVIPVIGRELVSITDPEVDSRTLTIDRWVAEQLAAKDDLPPDAFGEGQTKPKSLDEYVRAAIIAGGQVRDIYGKVRVILRAQKFEPPEVLKKLAAITDFDLFITTSFDSLIADAVNQARFGGAEGAAVLDYSLKKVTDLPCPKSELSSPTVYHLFGKVSAIPGSFAISDEDVLEWITKLQSDTYTPEHLSSDMRENQLLLLGLRYSNWLARFFLRMAKGLRLSEDRLLGEVMADNRVPDDSELVYFLNAFSRQTQVFPESGSGSAQFVDELYDRWVKFHDNSEEIAPSTAAAATGGEGGGTVRFVPPKKEMTPGAVFISYARDDLECVKRLKGALDANDIPTWFDMDQLRPGEDFMSTIEKYIHECSCFVPVISHETARRDEGNFRREWRWAAQRLEGMKEGKVFVLPVIIDDSKFGDSGPPKIFENANYQRFEGGSPDSVFIDTLKELVEKAQS